MAVAEPERGQAGLPVFAIGNYEILLGVPKVQPSALSTAINDIDIERLMQIRSDEGEACHNFRFALDHKLSSLR